MTLRTGTQVQITRAGLATGLFKDAPWTWGIGVVVGHEAPGYTIVYFARDSTGEPIYDAILHHHLEEVYNV